MISALSFVFTCVVCLLSALGSVVYRTIRGRTVGPTPPAGAGGAGGGESPREGASTALPCGGERRRYRLRTTSGTLLWDSEDMEEKSDFPENVRWFPEVVPAEDEYPSWSADSGLPPFSWEIPREEVPEPEREPRYTRENPGPSTKAFEAMQFVWRDVALKIATYFFGWLFTFPAFSILAERILSIFFLSFLMIPYLFFTKWVQNRVSKVAFFFLSRTYVLIMFPLQLILWAFWLKPVAGEVVEEVIFTAPGAQSEKRTMDPAALIRKHAREHCVFKTFYKGKANGARTPRGYTLYAGLMFPFPVTVDVRGFEHLLLEARDMQDRDARKGFLTEGRFSGQFTREWYSKYFVEVLPQPERSTVPTMGVLQVSEETTGVPEFAFIASVVKAVYEKDPLGVSLALAMRIDLTSRFFALLNVQGIPELIANFWEGLEVEDTVSTGPSPWEVRDVLPSGLKHSPVVVKLTTLVSALIMSNFFQDSRLFKAISEKIDIPKVATSVVTAALTLEVIRAVWRGYSDFAESGDPWKFLGVPQEVEFIRAATSLLHRDAEKTSFEDGRAIQEEIMLLLESRPQPDVGEIATLKSKLREVIHRDQKLIIKNFSSRATQALVRPRELRSISQIDARIEVLNLLIAEAASLDFPENGRLRERLQRSLDEELSLLESDTDRLEPMVIFTYGEPGTGKSTLTTALMNLLAKRDGVDRCPGDSMSWIVHDKYPGESVRCDRFRYVLLNDIAADYSGFESNDKEPLEIALQRIIDNTPFFMRRAAVEDKGKLYFSLRYIIINSNFCEFKFATDSAKLIRRFASGVLAEQLYVRSGERLRPGKLTSDERAKTLRFRVVRASFENTHGNFSRDLGSSPLFLTAPEYFRRVVDAANDHWSHMEAQRLTFRDPASMCVCGVPQAMHKGSDGCYEAINETCVPTVGILEVMGFLAVIYLVFQHVFPSLVSVSLSISDHVADQCLRVSCELLERAEQTVPTILRTWFSDEADRLIALMRARVSLLWLRVKTFVRMHAKKLALLAATAAVGAFTWQRFVPPGHPTGPVLSRLTIDESSMYTLVPETKQVIDPGKLRSWAKTDPISHLVLQKRGAGFEDLSTLLRRATVQVKLSTSHLPGAFISVWAIFLDSHFLMINAHYLEWDDKGPAIGGTFAGTFYLEIEGKRCAFSKSDFVIRSDRDVAFVTNFWRFETPNLRKFLATTVSSIALDIAVIQSDVNVRGVASPVNVPFSGKRLDGHRWRNQSKKGDCGTPVLGQLGSDWFWFGVVSFSQGDESAEVFDIQGGFMLTLGDLPLPEVPLESVRLTNAPMTFDPLSVHSEYRWTPSPYLDPLGTVSGRGQTFNSAIRRTRLYEDISPRLSSEYSPPTKLGGMIDGEYVSAWSHTVKPMASGDDVPLGDLIRASDAYFDRMMSLVETKQAKDIKLAPLSLPEAFFGLRSSGIDGVPMATSVGALWREKGYTNKRSLFEYSEDGENYKLRSDFGDMVRRKVEDLYQGIVHLPLCEYVPKDEVRALEKIEQYKIRLFSVLDFDFNIIMRMFLMPLITVMLQNPEASCCYGGINAGSTSWTDLVLYLDQVDGEYSDADHSAFDSRHWRLIYLSASFWRKMAIRCGYDERDANVVYLLVMSITTQIISYKNDYFVKRKGLISGVIVTLILNSYANVVLMVAAFAHFTGKTEKDFFRYVRLAVVGDDNVHKISSEVIADFNMVNAQSFFSSAGYKITPASKEGEFKRGMLLSELTFLKRRFVLASDGYYRAPLDTDSIWRPFCFQELSPSLSVPQRLHDVYGGALREAFLHGGEKFAEIEAELKRVFEKHKLVYPSIVYETVLTEFLNGTFRTFACAGDLMYEEEVGCLYQSPSDLMQIETPEWKGVGGTLGTSASTHFTRSRLRDRMRLNYSLAQFNNNNNESAAAVDFGAGEIITDQVVTGETLAKPQVPRFISDYQPFLEHPVLLESVVWSPSSAGLAVVHRDIMDFFKTSMPDQLKKKYANFYFSKMRFQIKIVVQGAPQMSGMIVYSFFPRPRNSTSVPSPKEFDNVNPVNSRLVPHLCVDPSKSATYTLDLPLISATGVYNLGGTKRSGSYAMSRVILAPLTTGSSSSSNVTLLTYLTLSEVELMGLSTHATSPAKLEREGKVIARGTGEGSTFLGKVQRGLTIFSDVAGSVITSLQSLGFAKPPIAAVEATVLNWTGEPYSQVDGVTTGVMLGRSQEQTTSIDPSAMGGELDDMSLHQLAAKPGLISSVVLLGAKAYGDIVETHFVTPWQLYRHSADTRADLPPLTAVAATHTFWRGDITFTFEVIASVFARGSLLVAWDPIPGAAPTIEVAIATLKTVPIHFSGNCSVDITIPWAQPAVYLENKFPSVSGNNGMLYVYVLNPLVSNATAPTAHLLTSIRSENSLFVGPSTTSINSSTLDWATVATAPYVDWTEVQHVSLGTTEMGVFPLETLADASDAVRDLTGRMQSDRAPIVVSNVQVGYSTLSMPRVRVSTFLPTTDPEYAVETFYSYFSRAYTGVRGSFKVSFVPSVADKAFGRLLEYSSGLHGSGPLGSGGPPVAGSFYALVGANQGVSTGVDMIVPNMRSELFTTSFTTGIGGTGSGSVAVGNAAPIIFTVSPNPTTTSFANLFWGTGDDFIFGGFQGFPSIVTVP